MEWQHPVFLEMLQLGCSDPLKVMSTFQTYMKLCEVERVCEIDFFYNKDLDSVYLTSVSGKKKIAHFIVASNQDLSPSLLHKVSTELLKQHEEAELNVVVKTPDTSLLSYTVTQGLCPPPTPENTKLKKAHQEQIQFLHNELNRRKAQLYEEAKRKKTENLQVKEESDFCTVVKTGSDCVEPESECVELAEDCVDPFSEYAKELQTEDPDSADFKDEL